MVGGKERRLKMEFGIGLGDQVKLIKGTTYVVGRVRGIKLDSLGELAAIWFDNISQPFSFANGWFFVEVLTEEQIAEIEQLNALLEEGEDDNGSI